MYATLSFIFVIVVLGLPMWWKTTEVYRVTLPFSGIEDLSNTAITVTSRVGIFTNSNERSMLLVQELNDAFKDNDIFRLEFYQIQDPQIQSKKILTPIELETIILRNYSIGSGEFIFLEWQKLTEDILVTNGRSAFISPQTSSKKIQQVLRSWIFQEHRLRQILSNINQNSGSKQRSLNAAPQPYYDVIISVLNPRPDIHNIQWNVRSASEAYVQPFLEQLNQMSNFSLKTEWKYQVSLDFPSQQIKDNSILGRHYSLPEEYLPHIITSVEKKLGNPITDNPCIHLVVYIPPCETSPLHIYNKQRQRRSTNDVESFISVKWGGIVIQNPDPEICLKYLGTPDERVNIEIRSEQVMQVIVHLLRKIIDIEVNIPIDKASITPLDSILPRQWEIDAYIRSGTIHLASSTTLTLQSLIQLLGGISNIVINDEVGYAVNQAYEHLLTAKSYLHTNDLLNATIFAKKSFIASETAFFHPSMLALLYFPDDQKYAIYIPLFFPIMIPVVLSLKSLRKYFKKKNDTENIEETEKKTQ